MIKWIMNYCIVIYCLIIFIQKTISLEYDDEEDEKQATNHSGSKY